MYGQPPPKKRTAQSNVRPKIVQRTQKSPLLASMNSRMPRSIINCVMSERDQRLKAAFKIYGTTAASDLV